MFLESCFRQGDLIASYLFILPIAILFLMFALSALQAKADRKESLPGALKRTILTFTIYMQKSHCVTREVDLTFHEEKEEYLEGTGSVVFDHVSRICYACRRCKTIYSIISQRQV